MCVQAQLGHKTPRVREQVLLTVGLLHDKLGDALRPTVAAARVAALLADTQASVRQVATDTLAKLRSRGAPADSVGCAQPEGGPVASSTRRAASTVRRPLGATVGHEERSRPVIALSGRENNLADEEVALDVGKPRLSLTSVNRRSASAAPQRVSLGFTTPQLGSAASPASFSLGAAGFSAGEGTSFSPESFAGLLADGAAVVPVVATGERDLARQVGKVGEGLENADDWNARVSALQLLQSLASGNMSKFEGAAGLVKAMVAQVRRGWSLTHLNITFNLRICRSTDKSPTCGRVCRRRLAARWRCWPCGWVRPSRRWRSSSGAA